ncbi:MAG: hypothetical protein HQK83_05410 [Fibrobacteria bacterium]|nr:hypothetical protein [Fibrobacteria bacterium]
MKQIITQNCVQKMWILVLTLIIYGAAKEPVNIIFDTDFGPDCDDAGALAILHRFADLGEARILAMAISTSNPNGPAAIDAVNTYYGRPDIPIGTMEGSWKPDSPYTSTLADTNRYPSDIGHRDNVPTAVEVYRKALEAAPDSSVTFVVVGFMYNINPLINSEPDSISPLTGLELIKKKVKHYVGMDGFYPSGPGYNWIRSYELPKEFLEKWPTETLHSGQEIGEEIRTGGVLSGNDSIVNVNPVAMAYKIYQGAGRDRPSYDLTAVYLAVRGLGDSLWTRSEEGCNSANLNGENTWVPGDCGHYYIIRNADESVVEDTLDALMMQKPVPDSLKPDFNEVWPPLGISNKSELSYQAPKAVRQGRGFSLSLYLNNDAPVVTKIYTTGGSLVQTIDSGMQQKGMLHVTWAGTDSYGKIVKPGIYFIAFHLPDGIHMAKVSKLR